MSMAHNLLFVLLTIFAVWSSVPVFGQEVTIIPTGQWSDLVNMSYVLGQYEGSPAVYMDITAKTRGYIGFGKKKFYPTY